MPHNYDFNPAFYYHKIILKKAQNVPRGTFFFVSKKDLQFLVKFALAKKLARVRQCECEVVFQHITQKHLRKFPTIPLVYSDSTQLDQTTKLARGRQYQCENEAVWCCLRRLYSAKVNLSSLFCTMVQIRASKCRLVAQAPIIQYRSEIVKNFNKFGQIRARKA